MSIVGKSQSGRACAEPASRPSAPRSGGGAKRRALTSVSTRARCWVDDAAGDHNILRSTRVQFLSVPRARQQPQSADGASGLQACAISATAHKLLRSVFAVLRDRRPYRDPDTGYEALLVRRNAPRWLRKLREFDILVRNDDGTVSVRWPSFQNPEGSVTVN